MKRPPTVKIMIMLIGEHWGRNGIKPPQRTFFSPRKKRLGVQDEFEQSFELIDYLFLKISFFCVISLSLAAKLQF